MASGMSFISNRWVFTGPQSYKVKPVSDGPGYLVVSINAAGERPISGPIIERSRAEEMAGILNDRH